MAVHDGINTDSLPCSYDNQQHNFTIHPRHHSLPHHAYYQHQLGMQPHPDYHGSTIHHHPGHGPVGMAGFDAFAGPSSMDTVSAAAARARHSNVKIGRRPSHLPKELKMKDKSLPPQWQRELKQRKHGKQAGRWDVYIYSPCGAKFASRKKLRTFFEENNLPYDAEDFDFTPYGRHIDNPRNSPSSNKSNNGGGGSASVIASSNSSNAMAGDNGRHHSSTSTGSEGTHPGSNQSSPNNYSLPTKNHFFAEHRNSNMQNTNNSMNSNSYSYNSPLTSDFVGLTSGSFGGFDARMENPTVASALDIPQNDFISSNNTIQGDQNQQNSSSNTEIIRDCATTLPYHPSRDHHYPFMKPDSGNTSKGLGSDFISPVDIADILMDSSSDTSLIASACIPNKAPFYGESSQQQHSSPYGASEPDLNKLYGASACEPSAGMNGRSAFQGSNGNQPHVPSTYGAPMSNISDTSRVSEEGDEDDSLSSNFNASNAYSNRNSSGASGNGGPMWQCL